MIVRKTDKDWIIFGLALVASFLGLIAIASSNLTPRAEFWNGIPTEAIKQTILLGVGIGVFLLAQRLPAKWVSGLLWFFWIVGVVGVLLTFGPLGVTRNTQRLWLDVGLGTPFQPSEFVKVSTIILGGMFFATRGPEPVMRRTPQTLGQVFTLFLIPQIAHRTPYVIGLIGAGVIVLQKDLGTSAVIIFSTVVMHIVSGASWKRIAAVCTVFALVGGLFLMTSSYRTERIPGWWLRWDRQQDQGHQQTISEAGMSRGGPVGVGLARGEAKRILPVNTSDFVMTTVAEETGLWGPGLLLLTLGGLSLLMISRTGEGAGIATVAWTGMGAFILIQTFINFGMANALLPPIGLPLPFVSVGGSTLIAIWGGLGALISLSRQPIPEREPEPPVRRVYGSTGSARRRAPMGPYSTIRPLRRSGHETRADRRRNGRTRISRN
jgi:cell division protein FtsW